MTAPGASGAAILRNSISGAPDTISDTSKAAGAADAAAGKARKKASTGIDTLRLGTPGTSTVKPTLKARTLLGGY